MVFSGEKEIFHPPAPYTAGNKSLVSTSFLKIQSHNELDGMRITDHTLGGSHIWVASSWFGQDNSHCTYQSQIQRFANLPLSDSWLLLICVSVTPKPHRRPRSCFMRCPMYTLSTWISLPRKDGEHTRASFPS